jgi:nuclear transport factor 2 (NTF2) superfamily protein
MCYEMGIENYEKKMNSIDQKKKTIKEFVERDYYNEHVRNLIDECFQKDRNDIALRKIIEVINKMRPR